MCASWGFFAAACAWIVGSSHCIFVSAERTAQAVLLARFGGDIAWLSSNQGYRVWVDTYILLISSFSGSLTCDFPTKERLRETKEGRGVFGGRSDISIFERDRAPGSLSVVNRAPDPQESHEATKASEWTNEYVASVCSERGPLGLVVKFFPALCLSKVGVDSFLWPVWKVS